ncbi:ATP-binding protein [Cylindrospermopsis raciborskii Cr2010]|jgi:DNA polymerase III delta prime subunit|uniref:ATP-binding protein n=1 Tax=Cylindrospermopsis raciborskii TaxID=77022 RepID=UPI001F2E9466|nr:ATP-binding protein [Cylindrospermopsis raciborskii]UJL32432.1 ATP-binding protein [Cylindrospermopsis raciborskii Cr2010]UJS04881.1 ATP-binding protein [Cylindrospermopsis raciborskii KLL07]
MPKQFNTAGPCQSDIHYMLSPTGRLPQLKALIDGRNYFIIHAPRQVGKTTAMIALAQELTDSGEYTAVMLSVEVGSVFPDEPERAERAILGSWQDAIDIWLPQDLHPPFDPERRENIGAFLKSWAKSSPRPLVVFIDEIDSLQNQTLISVLRQLRDGFPRRPQGFPHSVGLIGMRDVRDYKVKSGGSERLNTSSPFNIKAESLTLSNFSFTDIQNLYEQHTTATGQVFTLGAVQQAYYLTDGQPWLVNALARQATQVLVQDVNQPITAEMINQAKEILIQRQDTHLDSLAERLREERVKTIIEPILAGEDLPDVPPDDIRYVLDLGLCRDQGQGLEIANPIYKEVLPLVLSYTTRVSIGAIEPLWLNEQGELLPDKLLHAFLEFWRQHGEPLLKSAPYHEIAPHLVLMAFLHRVVNGGGTLEREYAIGSGRMDICLRYGKVVMGMELKLWRERKSDPLIKGLTQLDKYLDGLGLDTGWLVIFDRRPGLPPMGERISTEKVISPRGRTITLIRS